MPVSSVPEVEELRRSDRRRRAPRLPDEEISFAMATAAIVEPSENHDSQGRSLHVTTFSSLTTLSTATAAQSSTSTAPNPSSQNSRAVVRRTSNLSPPSCRPSSDPQGTTPDFVACFLFNCFLPMPEERTGAHRAGDGSRPSSFTRSRSAPDTQLNSTMELAQRIALERQHASQSPERPQRAMAAGPSGNPLASPSLGFPRRAFNRTEIPTTDGELPPPPVAAPDILNSSATNVIDGTSPRCV